MIGAAIREALCRLLIGICLVLVFLFVIASIEYYYVMLTNKPNNGVGISDESFIYGEDVSISCEDADEGGIDESRIEIALIGGTSTEASNPAMGSVGVRRTQAKGAWSVISAYDYNDKTLGGISAQVDTSRDKNRTRWMLRVYRLAYKDVVV